MHPTDLARELEKAHTAVGHAVKHLRATNQANAALHLSDEVLYSPLTVELMNAEESLARCLDAVPTLDRVEVRSPGGKPAWLDDEEATDG